MKKLLTAIAATALLVAGIPQNAQANFPYLGPLNAEDEINSGFQEDLTLLLNNTNPNVGDESIADNGFREGLTSLLNTSYQAFYEQPETLLAGWGGEDGSPKAPGGLFGEYCKNGCCVNADCALDAIGWGLRVQCAGCGNDVGCWAECVKSKNEEAFYSAVACTSGNCPISTTPGSRLFACRNSKNALVAGQTLLMWPESLKAGNSQSISVDLLSQS